ncbi:MAG: hypothetical protein IPG02_09045 [Ignavibacteria bacterium]|nr:hypothetical protein [Ignavibacteria bacterium]
MIPAKMYLGANGSATYTFNNPAIINNTQYYIQVKHRNSIETWNKEALSQIQYRDSVSETLALHSVTIRYWLTIIR